VSGEIKGDKRLAINCTSRIRASLGVVVVVEEVQRTLRRYGGRENQELYFNLAMRERTVKFCYFLTIN
jgi:hypothetical protein